MKRNVTFVYFAMLLAVLALAYPQTEQAQYPQQADKFVVGFPAGGTPDVFLRHSRRG